MIIIVIDILIILLLIIIITITVQLSFSYLYQVYSGGLLTLLFQFVLMSKVLAPTGGSRRLQWIFPNAAK